MSIVIVIALCFGLIASGLYGYVKGKSDGMVQALQIMNEVLGKIYENYGNEGITNDNEETSGREKGSH